MVCQQEHSRTLEASDTAGILSFLRMHRGPELAMLGVDFRPEAYRRLPTVAHRPSPEIAYRPRVQAR